MRVDGKRPEREAVEAVRRIEDARLTGRGSGDLERRSTASAPVLAGTMAETLPGASASSRSASTPFNSVAPSLGRLAVRAASTSSIADMTRGWLRPIVKTPRPPNKSR